jgi:hypothetical protein
MDPCNDCRTDDSIVPGNDHEEGHRAYAELGQITRPVTPRLPGTTVPAVRTAVLTGVNGVCAVANQCQSEYEWERVLKNRCHPFNGEVEGAGTDAPGCRRLTISQRRRPEPRSASRTSPTIVRHR